MDIRTDAKLTSRRQLLERLIALEGCLESFHPEQKRLATGEKIAECCQTAEALREYLATHASPREMVKWYELPDTEAEIIAFAAEMQAEHGEILRGLDELLKLLREIENSLDRVETSGRIWKHGHTLANRVARHAAGEAASLGRAS